jgi:hypothetical protein
MPIARDTISAFAIGTWPSPANRSASTGATSQARTAMGSAAAAQIAKIARRPNCGISTAETPVSARDGACVRGNEVSI